MRCLAPPLLRLAAIGGAILFPPRGGAADNAEAWRAVTRIRGSITVEYHTWIHEAGGASRTTSDTRETGEVRFVLGLDRGEEIALPPGLPPEAVAAMRSAMRGTQTSPAQVSWRAESAAVTGSVRLASSVVPYGETTGEASFSGEVPNLKDFVFVLTPATGAWQIVSPGKLREKFPVTLVHTGDDPRTDIEFRDAVPSVVFNGTVTGKPGAISAAFRDEGQIDRQPTRGFTKAARLRLWPEMDDVEVELTIEGYAKWRPEGSIAKPAAPGNRLVARATLVPKGGARVQGLPEVKMFRFELTATSREPGICLNWPLGAKDDDYDFRLAAAPSFAAQLSEKDQVNEVAQPRSDAEGRPYAESQIDSYDFGGRSSLRVVCTLADDREIVGVMKSGDAGRDLVELPKRKGADWIAEAWRKYNQAEKLADNDDNEEVAGQRHNGDGFTLYEEYRGWVHQGKRLEGHPGKKDFFVHNPAGADAKGGIALFERVSQLRVHAELRASEIIVLPVIHAESEANAKGERIMNFNHRDGPHRVDQHGVVVVTTSGFGSRGGGTEAVKNDDKASRAFRPGKVQFVRVEKSGRTDGVFSAHAGTADYNLSAREASLAYDRGVAHELLHAVGVDHHGEGQETRMLYFQGAGDPMNSAHRPRFVGRMPPSREDLAGRVFGQPAVWSDFDRGPTITLRWEDTGEDVAQSLSADFERELSAERGDPRYEQEGSERAAEFPQYGKDAAFWSVMGAYNNVSAGSTKRGGLKPGASRFNRLVTIGRPHETDSGNELCLMRYYFANAYPVDAGETAFYLVRPGGNRAGREICRSPEGTGANAPEHAPKSRFGNSAPGRGGCFAYICPNDAIPPRSL